MLTSRPYKFRYAQLYGHLRKIACTTSHLQRTTYLRTFVANMLHLRRKNVFFFKKQKLEFCLYFHSYNHNGRNFAKKSASIISIMSLHQTFVCIPSKSHRPWGTSFFPNENRVCAAHCAAMKTYISRIQVIQQYIS